MVETLVSLLITGGLVVAAVVYFTVGRDARKINSVKTEFERAEDALQHILAKDLSSAIRVTGSSSANFSGITRLPNRVRLNGENDALLVLAERASAFSVIAPIELNTDNLAQGSFAFNRAGTQDDGFDFISNAIRLRRALALVTSKGKNIVIRSADPVITDQSVSFSFENPTPLFVSDFASQAVEVRAIDIIVYRMLNNKLVREVYDRIPTVDTNGVFTTAALRTDILANKLNHFKIDYNFESKRGYNITVIPAPYPVSSPAEVVNDGSANASRVLPAWRDVSKVYFEMKYDISDENIANESFQSEPRFQRENQFLYYKSSFVISPYGQALSEQALGLQGSDISCSVYNLNARCNPNCNSSFTQSASAAPYPMNWEGYRAGSPYCTCAWDAASNSYKWPEMDANVATIPNWTQGQDNTRIDACVQVFQCSNYPIYSKSPFGQTACQCLRRDATHADVSPSNQTFLTTVLSSLDDSHQTYSYTNASTTSVAEYNCNQWDFCDPYRNQIVGGTGRVVFNQCKCHTKIDNNSMYKQNLIGVCGLENAYGTNFGWYQDLQCPAGTTFTADAPASRKFLLYDAVLNPQGFTELEAEYCACMQHVNDNSQGYLRSPSPVYDTSGNRQFESADGATQTAANWLLGYQDMVYHRQRIDFRVPRSAATSPIPPEIQNITLDALPNQGPSDPISTAGSLEYMKVQVKMSRPQPGNTFTDVTLNDVNCGQVLANTTGASGVIRCGQAYDANETMPASVRPGFESYSGYCRASCNADPVAQSFATYKIQRDTAEINRVRQIITNTPSGQLLPLDCGGSANSGGTVNDIH